MLAITVIIFSLLVNFFLLWFAIIQYSLTSFLSIETWSSDCSIGCHSTYQVFPVYPTETRTTRTNLRYPSREFFWYHWVPSKWYEWFYVSYSDIFLEFLDCNIGESHLRVIWIYFVSWSDLCKIGPSSVRSWSSSREPILDWWFVSCLWECYASI